MAAKNMLVILSNAHQARALSCAGHPVVRTPHLDALARRGTRFVAAYAPATARAPSFAALATGRMPTAIGRHLGDDDPYDGAIPAWQHAVRDAGRTVVAIGALACRAPAGGDHGFSHRRLAGAAAALPAAGPSAGPGESDQTRADRDIASEAQIWLREEAPRQGAPWCLLVSLATPGYPLIAPPEHYYAADPERLPLLGPPPAEDEAALRRRLAAYYGLVAFADEQVGRILDCLEQTGLVLSTRVLYAATRGESAGLRGLWGTPSLHEESVGVPMILAGHGVPQRTVVATPVSLRDLFPTVLDTLGLAAEAPEGTCSLVALARGARPARAVVAEHRPAGGREPTVMLRDERWKLICRPGQPPQLFDLDADPDERADLGASPAHAALRERLEARLAAALGAGAETSAGRAARR
ncbi:sulfatase-like hydrolase/transferase [Elioraea sp. Yellowstone]|jgi:choline-sulfatase|uniref:sulfatase-like hydrolase/transferase n=1 Tax=Elioraea sp. Yellowstone TaxID=2592070 RepID=UPI0011533769|nr:sulfatase-like hydrolase/transferase [Elioraea sp. Yellowstone]TQF84838.1 sulfatase-like hydrolase/transferase [Elioraea sp. Yellowstone]